MTVALFVKLTCVGCGLEVDFPGAHPLNGEDATKAARLHAWDAGWRHRGTPTPPVSGPLGTMPALPPGDACPGCLNAIVAPIDRARAELAAAGVDNVDEVTGFGLRRLPGCKAEDTIMNKYRAGALTIEGIRRIRGEIP